MEETDRTKLATLYVTTPGTDGVLLDVTNGVKVFARLMEGGTLYLSGIKVEFVDDIPVRDTMLLSTPLEFKQDGRS